MIPFPKGQIDAMGPNAHLDLSIENNAQNEVEVTVRDTGCGVPVENIGTMFEPFFTAKGDKGTGIGLWVVKGIVERLGDRISVVSSTTGDAGTSFTIVLPSNQSQSSSRRESSERSA
jgi:signal transduction histidine kinase